jgi:hypothetical protein
MTGNNRLFVLIALFLVGMLVLGLLAIGGVVIFGSINRAQQAARPTATSTLPAVALVTPTWTPSATPSPTNTSLPTATPTKVVVGTPTPSGEATPTPVPPPTHTPVPGATPVGEETPPTGIGGFGAVLAAIGLAGVLFIARRMRTAS